MCNDSIALALIRISSFQIGNDGDYKSILICGLLRECKLKSVNTRGPKSKNKAINTESTFFVESITVLSQQVWKSGGSTERSTPPQSNIRASIPPAKFHHLAGKVSKSCYKLREDRVATHLPTLHWCPKDVMRIIPLLSDARRGKKNNIMKVLLIFAGFELLFYARETQWWQRKRVSTFEPPGLLFSWKQEKEKLTV